MYVYVDLASIRIDIEENSTDDEIRGIALDAFKRALGNNEIFIDRIVTDNGRVV